MNIEIEKIRNDAAIEGIPIDQNYEDLSKKYDALSSRK